MNSSILSKIGSLLRDNKKVEHRIENTVNGHPDKIIKGPSKRVNLPETSLVCAETDIDGKPHICLLNKGIYGFEDKAFFKWFLILEINYDKLANAGMPKNEDVGKMQDFFEVLNENLVNGRNHTNALFLGRVTGNGVSQFMWYVNNPELANSYLQGLISSEKYPFEFFFEMSEDPEWKEAEYWLAPLKK